MKASVNGIYVKIKKSSDRPGFVEKRLIGTVSRGSAEKIKETHDLYVNKLKPVVDVPETVLEIRPTNGKGSPCEICIIQQDMSLQGGNIFRAMFENANGAERKEMLVSLFDKTVNFQKNARMHCTGYELGLDSKADNWWINGKDEWKYVDTMPPLIRNGKNIDMHMLIPSDDFPSTLMREVANLQAIRLLLEKPVIGIFFNPPTMLRYALSDAIYNFPSLKRELRRAAHEFVSNIENNDFKKQCECAISEAKTDMMVQLIKITKWLAKNRQ